MKRVFLETYGCQMNVADSELMAGVLERAGMELVPTPENADAVILNTCAIREMLNCASSGGSASSRISSPGIPI